MVKELGRRLRSGAEQDRTEQHQDPQRDVGQDSGTPFSRRARPRPAPARSWPASGWSTSPCQRGGGMPEDDECGAGDDQRQERHAGSHWRPLLLVLRLRSSVQREPRRKSASRNGLGHDPEIGPESCREM